MARRVSAVRFEILRSNLPRMILVVLCAPSYNARLILTDALELGHHLLRLRIKEHVGKQRDCVGCG